MEPPSAERERAGLEQANARWYLGGLAASLIGNSAMSLVAGIWVKTLTGSSAEAGLVSACTYAGTVIGPVAGLVADRVPRRRALIVLNLVAALTLLPLLAIHSRSGAWLVFAVMLVYGIEATFMDPAEDALFAELFTVTARQRLLGRRLAIQETGRLVAPLLGAAVFVAAGGGAVAAIDAATFVCAALTLARIRPRAVPVGDAKATTVLTTSIASELLAGARHIHDTRPLRAVAAAAAAALALSAVGVAAQYSLVHGIGQRPAFLGVLTATLGGASVVASLTAGALVRRFGERTLCLVGLLDFAAGNVLRATGSLPCAIAGSAVLGFALPFVFLAALNLAQRTTPDELQGRVSAALAFVLFAPQAPLQAAGALLISHTSYSVIYLASAAVALAIAAALGLGPTRCHRLVCPTGTTQT